jgi:hypothetical protein
MTTIIHGDAAVVKQAMSQSSVYRQIITHHHRENSTLLQTEIRSGDIVRSDRKFCRILKFTGSLGNTACQILLNCVFDDIFNIGHIGCCKIVTAAALTQITDGYFF